MILADENRWTEASERTGTALQAFEEAGLTWGVSVWPALVARARLQGHDGDSGFTDTVVVIETVLVQDAAPPLFTLIAEVILGEILLERGDLDGAARWMRAGLDTLRRLPDSGKCVLGCCS